MPFSRHDVAREEVVHVGTDRHNLADKLVPNRHRHGNRLPGPSVPVVIDVQIGATDPSAIHADQDIIDADLRHLFQPQPRSGLPFHKRLNRRSCHPSSVSGAGPPTVAKPQTVSEPFASFRVGSRRSTSARQHSRPDSLRDGACWRRASLRVVHLVHGRSLSPSGFAHDRFRRRVSCGKRFLDCGKWAGAGARAGSGRDAVKE